MMNFDLSEEQQLYKATAEKFFSTLSVAEKVELRSSQSGYDLERWHELSELGLIMLAASEPHGGLGGSMIDLATIAEASGLHNAIDPWIENAALPVKLLDMAGRDPLLESLLTGEKVAALAFAETNARYNFESLVTEAKTIDGGYILNGTKEFVLGGHIADYLLVTAEIEGAFGLFMVPKAADGVACMSYQVADGSKAVKAEFTAVKLPIQARLAIDIDAFKSVVSDINLLACAEITGLCQHLLDETVDYVKQREQFGVSIGSFQVVQHALVDCYAELEQIRSMLLRTLLEPGAHEAERQRKISGAKAFIAERAEFIAGNAVQYHGAMGITEDVSVGAAMKRIILLSRLFGDPAHCLEEYLRVA